MQIRVSGSTQGLNDQLRAYAEYQVFVRLAPMARRIGAVEIVVTAPGDDMTAACAVSADLGAAGHVRARIERAQAIEAIDSAAVALAAAAMQRLQEGRSP